MSDRSFTITPAVRETVPLLVGLVGPSGSGKTYSALALAQGMQKVKQGPIIFIDTENRRALHYAEDFKFEHMDFGAPFRSLDYLAAIQEAASHDPAAIIVDSMSHEHEGPGGMIDFHAKEVERMSNGDYRKAERVQMLAWRKPKAERRALLNGLTRVNQNIILCFRAGEKSKPGNDAKGKSVVVDQGFTAIAAPEFVFEMSVCALLQPGSQGVPTWSSNKPGESAAIKRPGWASNILPNGAQLGAQHGEALANWAKGTAPAQQRASSIDIDALTQEGDHAASLGTGNLQSFWSRLTKQEQTLLSGIKDEKWKPKAIKADSKIEDEVDVPF